MTEEEAEMDETPVADGGDDADTETPNDATEAEEATDDETAEEATGIQDGDFVKLDYTARTVENDQLVDTTSEEVAEEEGIEQEGQEFEPRTIVLGEGHLFDAVEDAIRGGEIGDTGTVVVPAADAFGEYDDDEVRTVSAEKIPEDNRHPGAQVQIDGQEGFVNTIIGGRARVDFNHPLAGEDVEYEYEVLDVVDDEVEMAKGLFEMFFDIAPEMWIETDEVEEETMIEPDEDDDTEDDEDAEPEFETEVVEKRSLYVESVPQLQMNQQWMFGKQQVAQQIMSHVDIDRVVVQEVIDGGGMGGMMGGMGGMMGGGAGDADAEAVEEALEDADVDADEIAAELDDE